jgi:hypothetical protein
MGQEVDEEFPGSLDSIFLIPVILTFRTQSFLFGQFFG